MSAAEATITAWCVGRPDGVAALPNADVCGESSGRC
jgi:hypothetical protein